MKLSILEPYATTNIRDVKMTILVMKLPIVESWNYQRRETDNISHKTTNSRAMKLPETIPTDNISHDTANTRAMKLWILEPWIKNIKAIISNIRAIKPSIFWPINAQINGIQRKWLPLLKLERVSCPQPQSSRSHTRHGNRTRCWWINE